MPPDEVAMAICKAMHTYPPDTIVTPEQLALRCEATLVQILTRLLRPIDCVTICWDHEHTYVLLVI